METEEQERRRLIREAREQEDMARFYAYKKQREERLGQVRQQYRPYVMSNKRNVLCLVFVLLAVATVVLLVRFVL